MKLASILLVASLLASMVTADTPSNLRSLAEKKKKNDSNGGNNKGPSSDNWYSVSIAVDNVDNTQEYDTEAFNQAFVDAYNKIHKDSDFNINSLVIDKKIAVPHQDGSPNPTILQNLIGTQYWWSYRYWFWGFGSWGCNLCRNDDDYLPPLTIFVQSNEHKSFEAQFCKNLKKVGGAFQDAKDCTVDFLYSAALLEKIKMIQEQATMPVAVGSQVEIAYIPADATSNISIESGIFTLSFVEAYNAVHPDVQLTSANYAHELDVGDGPNGQQTRHVWLDLSSTSGSIPPAMFVLDSVTHQAFERMLCDKLRQSSVSAYKGIEKCSVVFSYHGDVSAMQ